jgi:hypothetical protein
MAAKKNGWAFVPEADIAQIESPITVFVREPKERFVSGVNTFVQHLHKTEPSLDTATILFFVDNYLFLNRHYTPQFFWLLNLARYSNPNTLVTFRSLRDIDQLTDIHSHAEVEPVTAELLEMIDKFNWSKLELYFYLDQILVDHIGQTMSIKELFQYVKQDHPQLYELVFKKTQDIVDVLP